LVAATLCCALCVACEIREHSRLFHWGVSAVNCSVSPVGSSDQGERVRDNGFGFTCPITPAFSADFRSFCGFNFRHFPSMYFPSTLWQDFTHLNGK
jgi:hypothetical protein